ncbi:hypothetical protein [Pseudoalteromonas sp.]|uniref:hypothetical protein n=1 Tax=Pseudoalteromonas sp. TaxID=53249 RepID=UPI00262E69B2|nr:hypothetical protein [Pseudoalteromonas sp.]MCP4585306.1 hypothetical protein [Pseudoalteromonas sp.]
MAGVAYVYKRLWNAEVVIDPNLVLPFKGYRYVVHGSSNPHYHVKWHGTTQAGEELGTAMDSDKDGTTTPFQITVVSSSNSDKRTTSTGMVHSVCLIGNSVKSIANYVNGKEEAKTTLEVVAMNGTTDVLSTRYYTSVFHAFACEWGTGATHDAEGNITIESPANTTLLTIAATYNESDGGTIHFVDKEEVKIYSVAIKPTATVAAGDGASLVFTWSGMSHTLNDSNIVDCTDTFTYMHYDQGLKYVGEDSFPRQATKAGKVVLSEKLIANAQPMEIEAIIECCFCKLHPINVNPD